ncbi:putative protein TPRXL [Lates japonicus]|uniref:Uncharacterized protein n=1 Tax=Lates japonicus TaxID=270547 RepID=A0AAD3NHJ3_LATJO|nr:putative protein TPRXL [Lates japonicus]
MPLSSRTSTVKHGAGEERFRTTLSSLPVLQPACLLVRQRNPGEEGSGSLCGVWSRARVVRVCLQRRKKRKMTAETAFGKNFTTLLEEEVCVLVRHRRRRPRLQRRASPELQAEFLQECRNKLRSFSDVSESSVLTPAASPSSPLPSPFSPTPSSSPSPRSSSSSSSSSPSFSSRPARLSLSSPELLSELKESRTRPLRHVPAHNGLTTVFSGRGRGQVSGSALSTRPANQKSPP